VREWGGRACSKCDVASYDLEMKHWSSCAAALAGGSAARARVLSKTRHAVWGAGGRKCRAHQPAQGAGAGWHRGAPARVPWAP